MVSGHYHWPLECKIIRDLKAIATIYVVFKTIRNVLEFSCIIDNNYVQFVSRQRT